MALILEPLSQWRHPDRSRSVHLRRRNLAQRFSTCRIVKQIDQEDCRRCRRHRLRVQESFSG